MITPGSVNPGFFAPQSGGYSIANSLRFDGVDDYLSRTLAGSTANTKHIASFWHKRSSFPAAYKVLYSSYQDASNYAYIYITSTGQLGIYQTQGGVNNLSLASIMLLRDPAAWYHIYYRQDTTQATASARFRVWINGVEITSWATNTNSTTQNVATQFGSPSGAHYLGAENTTSSRSEGYFAEFIVVTQPTTIPEVGEFGETSADGVWIPKAYTGTYGTYGSRLEFKDGTSTTTLGYDTSGNNNHWTLSGMTRAAGTSECWMTDTPTNNFATLNPLRKNSTITLGNGALHMSASDAGAYTCLATIIPDTGLWYVEHTISAATAYPQIGIGDTAASFTTSENIYTTKGVGLRPDGTVYRDNVLQFAFTAAVANDVIGEAYDAANRRVYFSKNGVWLNSADPAAGTGYVTANAPTGQYAIGVCTNNAASSNINFGQRAFAYTPPTGYKALCTANLPVVAIPNPSQHHYVKTLTKAGDTSFTLPWDASTYDTLFMVKRRDLAGSWQQIDGLRGYDKILHSDTTAAETTDANVLGVVGTTITLKSSLPDGVYVVQAWKAGLAASRQTNTDGTITTTVSRNITAGFSIVTSTGTGANATAGHGLGVAPKMITVKERSGGASSGVTDWGVYHSAIGNTGGLRLNLTAAQVTGQVSWWNNTSPTSTVVSLGTMLNHNELNGLYVMFCFAEIAGYSKAISAVGNLSADGWYVNLGFRAREDILKNASIVANWLDVDTARDTYNVCAGSLYPNTSDAEGTGTVRLDITASGIKCRDSNTLINGSGNIIIGFAFAEHPFGGSNCSPSPAR